MAQYQYRALDITGTRHDGQLEAASLETATSQLQERGLIIVQLGLAAANANLGLQRWFQQTALSHRQLTRFTQQLATLLQASQPLEKSLGILLRQLDNPKGTQLIGRIRERVKGGQTLSAAMGEEQGQFSPLYLSLVRAGEAGGALGDTLTRLTLYLERAQALRSDVTNALIYPAFLLVGVLGSLGLLLAYVVPQFIPIFDGLGVPVPMITKSILWLGEFLSSFGIYLMAGFVVLLSVIFTRLRDPVQRLAWDRRVLRFRVFGPLLRLLETARLARTLGTLLSQGVPLLNALGIGQQVCNNSAVRLAVEHAVGKVKDGGALSAAMEAEKVLPELALQMIRVGEESGQLDTMLLKVADVFDEEAKRGIDRLLAALVPTLTLVMASFVAFIMLAIMLPLMSLTSNI